MRLVVKVSITELVREPIERFGGLDTKTSKEDRPSSASWALICDLTVDALSGSVFARSVRYRLGKERAWPSVVDWVQRVKCVEAEVAWIVKASILIQRIDRGHVVAGKGEGKACEIFLHSLELTLLTTAWVPR